MRLRVIVFSLCVAAFSLSSPASANERSDRARHTEQVKRAKPPGPTEWRLADLEAKERAGAKLSAQEKVSYDRLKEERKKRYQDLAETDAKKEQDRETRRQESRRRLLDRYHAAAANPDVQQEFERDAQITARLQRAREIAQAEGRDDAVARVDKLVQQETARHAAWLAAHGHGE
jgi:hypothetical protein